jgi:CheY-like chemotaxis protein
VVAPPSCARRKARDEARLHRAEAERQQLEKNVLEARLQLMQAQVEPHFLFNTLANVQHLVETDPPAASRMLESLIQYLRAALPQMRESTTTSGARWTWRAPSSRSIACAWARASTTPSTIPSHLRCAAFPPMMLISLVENALKHGVDPRCECSSVAVSAVERDGKLVVSVADYRGRHRAETGRRRGLSNIRERLKALHGPRRASCSRKMRRAASSPRSKCRCRKASSPRPQRPAPRRHELAGHGGHRGRRTVPAGAAALAPRAALARSRGRPRDARRARRGPVVEEHSPALFFLDIHMPGVNGLEAARQIGSRAHIVFVTAYDQHAVEAFERGAIDYVLKPFNEERLAITVERLKARLSGPPPTIDALVEHLAERLGGAKAPSISSGSAPPSAPRCASSRSRKCSSSSPTRSTPGS